jgi:hypothetical protein
MSYEVECSKWNLKLIVGGSEVQVMVISIISLMRKKMVYLWMNCLMVIPQIWRHLLHIGWTGVQHFPGLHFELGRNYIFLTENWVPKIYFAKIYIDPVIIDYSVRKHSIWYVICVEFSTFFPPRCYYCWLIQKPKFEKCPYFLP